MASQNQSVKIIDKDDLYVLNHCAKNLARDNVETRHNFGQFEPNDARGRICDSWRFPIIDSYYSEQDGENSHSFNEVTFIFDARRTTTNDVSITGTFASLFEKIPLHPVMFNNEKTGYFTVTAVIPKGEAHTYKFIVDGEVKLDPINPQRTLLDNGEMWSRFFTHLCTVPLVLGRNEMTILDRLVDHILPFRTEEGERFLKYFYNYLDTQSKETQYSHAYRLDQSVGVVNFIDKLLAREENHHYVDYKICLGLIDKVLRTRNPYVEPHLMPKEMYIQIYNEMASGNVSAWDYSKYNNPSYFLQLLRRHTLTGAFSHPKYGGNVGGVCWAYLSERFVDSDTKETLFDWRAALEKPLGTNEDYKG
jgi:hypothetical protein